MVKDEYFVGADQSSVYRRQSDHGVLFIGTGSTPGNAESIRAGLTLLERKKAGKHITIETGGDDAPLFMADSHPVQNCSCGCGNPAKGPQHFVYETQETATCRSTRNICDVEDFAEARDIAHGLTLLNQVKRGELIVADPNVLRRIVHDKLSEAVAEMTPVALAGGPTQADIDRAKRHYLETAKPIGS